ncbi:MAG TPA: FemAB family XrtA/PEP-CTERM system-associated protein [Gemmatimonadaceae bacterium]|nr:FemAB family XrtA/PEP-CTERM system-associated protein [Gemmatimonadaceae bacterium]
MTIRVARYLGDGDEWNEFVRTQPDWTHFHLFGWRNVLERALGHECIYLEARDPAGVLVGVLPLVRVRSLLFGHYLVSMPFLNYGGPLGSVDGVRALLDESAVLARRDHVRLLELRSRHELPSRMSVSHRKITVVLDLPESSDALWKRLPPKLRSQIRRPQKEGVEIRSGLDQLAPFYHVLAPHMRDLGTSAQSFTFFRAIAEEFPDDLRVTCAYFDGQPIAAGCGLMWRDEFEITWASALRSHKHLSANMLVYCAMMERAIADGARIFNFGRCTPDSGTHRFKRQWPGARDEPLWWYQRSSREDAPVATPSKDDAGIAFAARVWSRMPLSVATRLGPSIVRYLP